jgi:CRISPR-associated exonuclease Cas4
MTIPVVLLVLVIVIFLVLRRWATSQRQSLGLEDGAVVAADDSERGLVTLRSERLGLVGRPDQILRAGRAYIPVEQKPSTRRLYPSHVMQVAAQCMLVEEAYGVRPPYGLVALAGGRSQRVAFTPERERRVLETMSAMRRILATGTIPGPRWVAAKCMPCGYRDVCRNQESAT